MRPTKGVPPHVSHPGSEPFLRPLRGRARFWATVSLTVLVAAACGGGNDVSSPPSTGDPVGTAAPAQPQTPAERLVVGTLLPLTGDLAFLGPPETAGARLAIADINAAGGVLGAPVTLHEADSGDTTQDIANPEVDRLLGLGADVIVGAASSAVSKLVIDKITGAGVIQFAPSNTSPDFTDYPDRGLYFRTAPSDLLQSRVLAELVASEGAETAGVVYRQESYGQGLADAFRAAFETLGGTVEPFLAYAPGTENFDTEVDILVEAGPDAILIIGFEESAAVVTTMHERGIGPTSPTSVYGVAGNISGIGAAVSEPSILAGMRGPETSVDLDSIRDFTDRLETAYQGGLDGVYTYGAETYDAVIIAALAAEAAGSARSAAMAAQINDITRGGQKCFSFAECRAVIAAGGDPDYDGAGGPYEFTDAGEPSVASYRIASYDGGRRPNENLDEYRLVGREADTPSGAEEGGLVMGAFLPVGDDLLPGGPARAAAVRMAVTEINAAGGVLGREVILHEADSAGVDRNDAIDRISRLLAGEWTRWWAPPPRPSRCWSSTR